MGASLSVDVSPVPFSTITDCQEASSHPFTSNLKAWEISPENVNNVKPVPFLGGTIPRTLDRTKCYLLLLTSVKPVGEDVSLIRPCSPNDVTPRGIGHPFFDSVLLRQAQSILDIRSTPENPSPLRRFFSIWVWNGVDCTQRTKFLALAKALELERKLIVDDGLAGRLLYSGQVTVCENNSNSAPTSMPSPRSKSNPNATTTNPTTATAIKPPPKFTLALGSLSAGQREVDEREQRLAQCTPVASEILEGKLFVGGEVPARNREYLQSLGITTIINMSPTNIANCFPQEFTYYTYDAWDSPSEDVTALVPQVLKAIHEGGCVYLHCQQGVSRSVTMAVAYVMWRNGMCADEALAYVKARRSIAAPNLGFFTRLLKFQQILLTPPKLRVMRVGPYRGSDTAPLVFHDVLPPVNSSHEEGPRVSCDPRAAYLIIFDEKESYVWVGRNCVMKDVVSSAAVAAAKDLFRYGYYTSTERRHNTTTSGGDAMSFLPCPAYATRQPPTIVNQGDEPKELVASLKEACGRPDVRIIAGRIEEETIAKIYDSDQWVKCLTDTCTSKSKDTLSRIVEPAPQLSRHLDPTNVSPRQITTASSPIPTLKKIGIPPIGGASSSLGISLPTTTETSGTAPTLTDGLKIYQYPDFNEVEAYEINDLNIEDAYVVVSVVHGKRTIYGWIGRDNELNDNTDLLFDEYAKVVGESALADSTIFVELDGNESDGFLIHF
eukprot:PhF_6_TR26199/c0_g1_i1/m.37306